MMKSLKTIALLCFCVLYSLSIEAQFSYDQVLKDSTFTSSQIEGIQEIIVNFPSNGTIRTIDVNGSEFYVEYTPLQGYLGLDTFSVEYLDQTYNLTYRNFIVDVQESFVNPQNDFIRVYKGSGYVNVDVLANDSFTAGPGRLSSVNHLYGLYAYVNNDSLFIKPKTQFTGLASASHSICDTLNNCNNANLDVLVIDSSMLANDTTLRLQMAENSDINFFLTSDQGTIIDDADHGITTYIYQNNGVNYKPFQNFVGVDTIIVADSHHVSTVIIEVFDLPNKNTFVVDDYIYVHPNDEVYFNVFDNDIVANAAISYFSSPNHGTLTKLTGGNFKFVPDSSYMGTTTFEYIVCLPAGGICETGVVTLFVNELTPDRSLLYELTTAKNRAFVINYDVPLTNFNFDIISLPDHGTLNVFSGKDTIQIGCEQVVGHNMVLYTPDQDFIGQDTFELKYCVDSSCTQIDIYMDVVDKSQDSICACLDDCVWPGDMNADGRVNMKDLLSLGYNLGTSGYVRPFGIGDWFGQYCPDWNMIYQAYNVDLKHLDADGDGSITTLDTAAISDFYGLQNTLLPKPLRFKQPYPISLKYVGPPSPQIGDLVSFDVIIGNASYPATQMKGFTFSLDVDPNVVDTSTLNVRFDHQSFLTYLNAAIDLQVKQGRRINMGISRTDKSAMSGYGRIATLDFVIEDEIDGIATGRTYPLTIKLNEISHMDSNGEIYNLPGIKETIYLSLDNSNEPEPYSRLRVYPNPVKSQDVIHAQMLGKGYFYSARIFSMEGKVITDINFDIPRRSSEIRIPQLSPGIYLIQFDTSNGLITEKIVIQ